MREIKQGEHIWSLGMMSGTSLDGIDLALILTDGETVAEFADWATYPIDGEMQYQLKGLMQGQGDALRIERDYTQLVVDCVERFLESASVRRADIDVMGFHGQTIIHRPAEQLTWQLGNPSLLTQRIRIPVVADFRRRDMAAGGQGAPLVPLYHQALVKTSQNLYEPVAIINIGGVANVTYIAGDTLLAFDTGPGNALINDWVLRHTGNLYDRGGEIARSGTIHPAIVSAYLSHPYFELPAPKSLDRNSFNIDAVEGLSVADGAATLMQVTVESIAYAEAFFPEPVQKWLICGGGRHNYRMLEQLQKSCGNHHVLSVDELGWRGDALEAEAFAFLAVRSLRGLPITLPTTTGAAYPVTSGVFCQV